jgi:energy-coupling factor transporter transmembrane protein EcfT
MAGRKTTTTTADENTFIFQRGHYLEILQKLFTGRSLLVLIIVVVVAVVVVAFVVVAFVVVVVVGGVRVAWKFFRSRLQAGPCRTLLLLSASVSATASGLELLRNLSEVVHGRVLLGPDHCCRRRRGWEGGFVAVAVDVNAPNPDVSRNHDVS